MNQGTPQPLAILLPGTPPPIIYAHINNMSVKKGEKVFRGQEIGGVGNTGRSTAAHLHYEVKRNNKTLDPRQYYMYNYKLEDLVYNR